MRYHFLVIPKELTAQELMNIPLRTEVNTTIASLKKILSKSLKVKKKHVEQAIHSLADTADIQAVCQKLAKGDELVIHADGTPFAIGLDQSSVYDLSAYDLACKLANNGLPKNIELNLDIIACDSATTYRNFNFAQDVSNALLALGYSNVSVYGYTGSVCDKGNGKFSVFARDFEDTQQGRSKHNKGKVASLEDARSIYKEGKALQTGKPITLATDSMFAGNKTHIARAKKDQAIIQKMLQPPPSSSASAAIVFTRSSSAAEKIFLTAGSSCSFNENNIFNFLEQNDSPRTTPPTTAPVLRFSPAPRARKTSVVPEISVSSAKDESYKTEGSPKSSSRR